mmetsp:Transcript_35520/g.99783  ORF Transcript_35520/g.99783 Transcript_35520/m.99783 type:complete len:225 (+) Transcript_35520:38-712(+)
MPLTSIAHKAVVGPNWDKCRAHRPHLVALLDRLRLHAIDPEECFFSMVGSEYWRSSDDCLANSCLSAAFVTRTGPRGLLATSRPAGVPGLLVRPRSKAMADMMGFVAPFDRPAGEPQSAFLLRLGDGPSVPVDCNERQGWLRTMPLLRVDSNERRVVGTSSPRSTFGTFSIAPMMRRPERPLFDMRRMDFGVPGTSASFGTTGTVLDLTVGSGAVASNVASSTT